MTEKKEESYASLISETISKIIEETIEESLQQDSWETRYDIFSFARDVSQRLVPKIELQVLEEIKKRIYTLHHFEIPYTKGEFGRKISCFVERKEVLEFLERKMAERK